MSERKDWFTDDDAEKAAVVFYDIDIGLPFTREKAAAMFAALPTDERAEYLIKARAALSAVNPYEWRPISEAKQDGTPIIGACFEGYPENRFCGRELWWQKEFEAWIAGARVNELAPGYTFEDGSTRRLHSPDIYHPTHYMPCPPSPEGNK